MRLFFALWPGDGVRAALARWSGELRAACGGRPVPERKLHLTLAFLGSVGPERLEEIRPAAGEVAPRSGVLVLDQAGYWKRNRIVWAGSSTVPTELVLLVAELRASLARKGIGFDAKDFVSHVTLLRDAHEPRAMPEPKPVRWEWDGFVLARSAAERGGPYELVDAWPLRTPR